MKKFKTLVLRFRRLQDVLFRPVRRMNWRLFSVFLVISAVYWFLLSLNEGYELERKIKVSYVLAPGKVLPDSVFSDSLYFKIQTKGWFLWNARWSRSIEIPAGISSESEKLFHIKQAIGRNHKKSVELKDMRLIPNPRKRDYGFKHMAVRLNYRLIPAPGYFIKNLRIKPDSVWIFGKKNRLKKINEIGTVRKKIENLKSNRIFSPPLHFPEGIHGFTDKIKLKVEVLPYVSEEKSVPVSLPDTLRNVILFPSQVRVYYKKYLDKNTKNGKARWVIGIELDSTGRYFDAVVVSKPSNVFDVEIEPKKIEYVRIYE